MQGDTIDVFRGPVVPKPDILQYALSDILGKSHIHRKSHIHTKSQILTRPPRMLEVVPGGLIREPLTKDPGTINWDASPKATFTVRVVNFEQFRQITRKDPPAPPTITTPPVVPRPLKRNKNVIDGVIISNAEYMAKHPLTELRSVFYDGMLRSTTGEPGTTGTRDRGALDVPDAAEAALAAHVRRLREIKGSAVTEIGGRVDETVAAVDAAWGRGVAKGQELGGRLGKKYDKVDAAWDRGVTKGRGVAKKLASHAKPGGD